MRQLITLVIAGSILVAILGLIGNTGSRDDDLSRSIAQMVEKSR